MPPWLITAGAGFERGLGCEIFRRVGLRPAGLACIVERGCPECHQICGLQLHPARRQRMLDRLVAPDRPAEYLALARVADGLSKRRTTQTDSLGGNEDPLRIHAVENELESLAFLSDAILDRHRQAIDEKLIGVDRLA